MAFIYEKLHILLKEFPMIPLNCVNWLWAEKEPLHDQFLLKIHWGHGYVMLVMLDNFEMCDDYLNILETDTLRYIHHTICTVYIHNTSE